MNSLFRITTAVLLLLMMGCTKDLCEEIDCMNEASCKHGICECAEGFEGEYCEKREIDKFLGVYPSGGFGHCGFAETVLAAHVISENPIDYQQIIIDDGTMDKPFYGIVDGWTFFIPEQNNSWTDSITGFTETFQIVGQGWIALDEGKLIYQFDNTGCWYELEYQR